MQRKTSYYLKKLYAVLLAAAAGVVVGLQIEATHTTRGNTQAYFVAHAYASDAFVQFATPPFVACAADCVDADRECATGVETECIYQ